METPIGEQLGLEGEHSYFVCCVECANKIESNDPKIYLAMFGPQGRDEEDSVLVCVPWDHTKYHIVPRSKPFFCDGCGELVSVAPSSSWFIEEHRKERE